MECYVFFSRFYVSFSGGPRKLTWTPKKIDGLNRNFLFQGVCFQVPCIFFFLRVYPNIAPENGWLKDAIYCWKMAYFSGISGAFAVSFRVCRDQCPMSNRKKHWFPAKITNDDDVVLLLGVHANNWGWRESKRNMKRPPSFDICMCHQSGCFDDGGRSLYLFDIHHLYVCTEYVYTVRLQ